ncbi:MAG: DUF1194 domain-containing protein [Sulfitobacter sp.]
MKAAVLAGLLALTASTAAAYEPCRQALALGLDVSGSVDAREYRLQISGVAQALNSTAVRAALMEHLQTPVELLIYEWSGPQDMQTLVPWTRISGPAPLQAVIDQLHATERRDEATPGTALGVAMMRGAQHLAQRQACWRKTLDISGDGKNNLGPRPRDIKHQLVQAEITINGLVVGAEADAAATQELGRYFHTEVILGPEAFVEIATGFEDYATTMEDKLLRELRSLILSHR